MIELDGGPPEYVDLYSDPATAGRIWQVYPLTWTNHHVRISWTGTVTGPYGHTVTFDSVQVFGRLLEYE